MSDDMRLVQEFAAEHSEPAFATLVQRHIGLVHSAALRQVSDPHLAEEITQAVFILLARKAGSLGPNTVLSSWLYRAARFVAADERKAQRRRMSREMEASMQSIVNQPEPDDPWIQLAPLLDKAMAELGETDRTALVLRYFDNKRAGEIAEALRLGEEAAQKRVTRALGKLRAIFVKHGVVLSAPVIAGALSANAVQAAPAGLAATIASTAVTGTVGMLGAGMGSKVLATLGKAFLFSWCLPLFSIVGALPSLLFVPVLGRMERKNFRDEKGFRPQLHQRFIRSFLWGFPVMLLVFVLIIHSARAAWGVGGQELFMAALMMVFALIAARSLMIFRNRFQVGMVCYCWVLAIGTGASALGWIPRSLSQLPMLLGTALLLLLMKRRPVRMDYSLFLRASQGLLNASEQLECPEPSARQFDRRALLAFARFLGSRYLASNFRWDRRGLLLRLPPVRNRFLANMISTFMPPISQDCSHILLGYEGNIVTHCGKADRADLSAIKSGSAAEPDELESLVEQALSQAWRAARHGHLTVAERAVGQVPASDIFVVPVERARATRAWQIYVGFGVLLMSAAIALQTWPLAWMDSLRIVRLSERDVRIFLNDTTPNPDPRWSKHNSPSTALFTCLVLPSTNLFSPEGLRAMRDEVAENGGFDQVRTQAWRGQWMFNAPLARYAMADGWVSWQDLNIAPADSAAALGPKGAGMFSPANWDQFLTRCQSWSWVKEERSYVLRIQSDGLTQLRLLRAVNRLDLTDREKLIRQIASVQVMSAARPDQRPLHDWRDVKGLFFTPCFPVLQDTYYAVAALEILGGLDRIDREACLQGILRRHHGKGYFTSPSSGGFNEYHIDGSTRDTIAAYESLRILKALDRVHDLPQWQFRVKTYRSSRSEGNGVRTLTWDEVEAWVCQQRLAQILQAHQMEPQRPLASLRQPESFLVYPH